MKVAALGIFIFQVSENALVLWFMLALVVDADVWLIDFLLIVFLVHVANGSAVSLETVEWGEKKHS